jgi:hypothetical protein
MNLAPEQSDGLALMLPAALLEVIRRAGRRAPGKDERCITEPWIGVEDAAAHLGCKPQRIYDLVCRRATSGIPHRKEGSRLLFRRSELDRWIDSGRAA